MKSAGMYDSMPAFFTKEFSTKKTFTAMSNATDYQDLLPEIQAIPDEEIIQPDMPVDIFNQEAENLFPWALQDKNKLIARGLKETTINELLPGIGACRQAQVNWFHERYGKQGAEKEWGIKGPQGYDLRDKLLDEFDFAFDEETSLLKRVSEIRAGTGNADMIQDLANLSGFGKANTTLLEATNFDMSLLDTAAELSDTLPGLLAIANGEKADDSAVKKIRDQAYTYLLRRVKKVRHYGKFVFKNDRLRRVGYYKHYRMRK